jgi:adenylylsulfate kinase-like enzyme
MRHFAREIIGEGFFEIYVKASLNACKKRDPKGLYQKAISGEIRDFTGVSAPYEEPENPELIIDTEKFRVDECVEKLINVIKE